MMRKMFLCLENDFENDIVSMYLTFFVKKGNMYERFEENHFERAYSEKFIEKTLKDIGFKIIGSMKTILKKW